MPEMDGKKYPYTDEGKRQAEIDKHLHSPVKTGTGDLAEPDKLNYDRYSCGRPYTAAVDGNLTEAGKAKHHPQVNPNPTKSSRPIPNGMFPMTRKSTSSGGGSSGRYSY